MLDQQPTSEEILKTITNARDSVWVINNEIVQTNVTKEIVKTVQRNVSHLQIVISKEHVINFGQDLSDLTSAITAGNTFIEQNQLLLED